MSSQEIEFIDHLIEKMCGYFKEAAHRAIQEHARSPQHTDKTSKSDSIKEVTRSISTQTECIWTEVQKGAGESEQNNLDNSIPRVYDTANVDDQALMRHKHLCADESLDQHGARQLRDEGDVYRSPV